MTRGWAVAAGMLGIAAFTAVRGARRAAQGMGHSIRGVRRNGPTFALHGVRSGCPAFVVRADKASEIHAPSEKPLKSWCAVDSAYALPAADGRRWFAVIYGTRSEYETTAEQLKYVGATRDTDVFMTAVLYSAVAASRPATSEWRAEWLTTVTQRITYSVHPDLVRRPDGSALVAVLFCFNGTGGCWQEYMHRTKGGWTMVVEAWRKQLPPIHDGDIGKGMGVTLSTMTGSYGVYGSHDPNCCPARELQITVDLRNDSLVLKGHKVVSTPL